MILLSFDTEEFDLPREHGVDISLDDSMAVSVRGINRILDMLSECAVHATFFCTVTFAEHAPQVMQRIVDEGHEVACHAMNHWNPQPDDAPRAKVALERLCRRPVLGYRQPRMQPVDTRELKDAGYCYDSSIHPTVIPGRYMHLNVSRKPYVSDGVLQIPVSVSPWLRLPVFWLACHNYPQWLYMWLCKRTLKHDGRFVIYFHPWEFVNLNEHPEWRIPWIIRRNSGREMLLRLKKLIDMMKQCDNQFITYTEFYNIYSKQYLKHHE